MIHLLSELVIFRCEMAVSCREFLKCLGENKNLPNFSYDQKTNRGSVPKITRWKSCFQKYVALKNLGRDSFGLDTLAGKLCSIRFC